MVIELEKTIEKLNSKYFAKDTFNGIKIGTEKENKVNPLLTCLAAIFKMVSEPNFNESENNEKLMAFVQENANNDFPLTFRDDLEQMLVSMTEAVGYSPLKYEQAKLILSFIKLENRALFNLPVEIEEFRALRMFLRTAIKTQEKVRVHNNPESLLIQEIKKFSDFYSYIIYKDGEPYVDSKFRQYLISFVSQKDSDLMKSLVAKFKNGIRVKIGVRETKNGKVIILTTNKKEEIQLIVHEYYKKDNVEK